MSTAHAEVTFHPEATFLPAWWMRHWILQATDAMEVPSPDPSQDSCQANTQDSCQKTQDLQKLQLMIHPEDWADVNRKPCDGLPIMLMVWSELVHSCKSFLTRTVGSGEAPSQAYSPVQLHAVRMAIWNQIRLWRHPKQTDTDRIKSSCMFGFEPKDCENEFKSRFGSAENMHSFVQQMDWAEGIWTKESESPDTSFSASLSAGDQDSQTNNSSVNGDIKQISSLQAPPKYKIKLDDQGRVQQISIDEELPSPQAPPKYRIKVDKQGIVQQIVEYVSIDEDPCSVQRQVSSQASCQATPCDKKPIPLTSADRLEYVLAALILSTAPPADLRLLPMLGSATDSACDSSIITWPVLRALLRVAYQLAIRASKPLMKWSPVRPPWRTDWHGRKSTADCYLWRLLLYWAEDWNKDFVSQDAMDCKTLLEDKKDLLVLDVAIQETIQDSGAPRRTLVWSDGSSIRVPGPVDFCYKDVWRHATLLSYDCTCLVRRIVSPLCVLQQRFIFTFIRRILVPVTPSRAWAKSWLKRVLVPWII